MTEKIVISQEECNAASVPPSPSFASPGSAWPKPGPTAYAPPVEPQSHWKGIVLAVVITAFLFAGLGMAAYCILGRDGRSLPALVAPPRTVDDFRSEFIARTDAGLASPGHAVRKYVEKAHVSVTVSEAHVKTCCVTTVDGSNLAGEDDSNISEVRMVVHCSWDGKVHKGGHTDVEITLDKRMGKVTNTRIVDTDALVNTEDPDFWITVGAALLEIL